MIKSKIFKIIVKAFVFFDANNTFLTVKECAELLKVHENTVRNRIESGAIKASFQDGKYHIPKIQFMEILLENKETKKTTLID